jgi:hypothetical protein
MFFMDAGLTDGGGQATLVTGLKINEIMAVSRDLVAYITSRCDNEGTRVTDLIGSRLGSVQSVNTSDSNKTSCILYFNLH